MEQQTNNNIKLDMNKNEMKQFELQGFNNKCIYGKYNNLQGYLKFKKLKNYELFSLYNYIKSNQKIYNFNDIVNTSNNYTYILYQLYDNETNKKTYHFAARPVYSQLESFSKHYSIFAQLIIKHYGIDKLKEYIDLPKYSWKKTITCMLDELEMLDKPVIEVVLSGEIKMKKSNRIMYNFSSGTFMKHRFYDLDDETIRHYAIMFEQIMREKIGFKGYFNYDESIDNTYFKENDFKKEIENIWGNIDIDELPEFLFFNSLNECQFYTFIKEKNQNNIINKLYDLFTLVKKYLNTMLNKGYIQDYDMEEKINEMFNQDITKDNFQINIKEKIKLVKQGIEINETIKNKISYDDYKTIKNIFSRFLDFYYIMNNMDKIKPINLLDLYHSIQGKRKQRGGKKTKMKRRYSKLTKKRKKQMRQKSKTRQYKRKRNTQKTKK